MGGCAEAVGDAVTPYQLEHQARIPLVLEQDQAADMESQPNAVEVARVVPDGGGHMEDVVLTERLPSRGRDDCRDRAVVGVHHPFRLARRTRRERELGDVGARRPDEAKDLARHPGRSQPEVVPRLGPRRRLASDDHDRLRSSRGLTQRQRRLEVCSIAEAVRDDHDLRSRQLADLLQLVRTEGRCERRDGSADPLGPEDRRDELLPVGELDRHDVTMSDPGVEQREADLLAFSDELAVGVPTTRVGHRRARRCSAGVQEHVVEQRSPGPVTGREPRADLRPRQCRLEHRAGNRLSCTSRRPEPSTAEYRSCRRCISSHVRGRRACCTCPRASGS